ncbi:MAG TPA: formyltransferase family protein [Bdellovibrionales bacterium]|nr:formyltransferase family protein [Bdellovibrionales bacterium]
MVPPAKPRWAVLISGRGSNLAALLDHPDEIDIRVVVSSSSKAEGLLRAKRAGIPIRIVETEVVNGKKKISYDRLTTELQRIGVTHVALAGYMRIIPPGFIAQWKNRIINLHPSLLPLYPGLDSIRIAHEEKSDLGITVHEVNEEVDGGRIIAQRTCLKSGEMCEFEFAEFLVHTGEQRLLKQVVSRRKHGD